MANVLKEKSKKFAVRVVGVYKHLCDNKREYIMSKQLVRSGTSIGANVYEALQGQSRADFIAKMSIALKEAAETGYWLELLHETGYLSDCEYQSVQNDCEEVVKLLTSIIKSSREKS